MTRKLHDVSAKDAEGNELKDVLDADTEQEAELRIRQMGYFVTKIKVRKQLPTDNPFNLGSDIKRSSLRIWNVVRAYMADEEPPKTLAQLAHESGIENSHELPKETLLQLLKESRSETDQPPVKDVSTRSMERVEGIGVLERVRSYVADEPVGMQGPTGKPSRWSSVRSYLADEEADASS
jgi:hypothetical protein